MTRPLASGRRVARRGVALAGAASLLFVATDSAMGGGVAERLAARWRRQVTERGLDPDRIRNPLELDDAARRLALRVAGGGSPLDRLHRLQRFLFDEEQFTFDSDGTRTRTAIEAYASRSGNCVSFTTLFVALGRAVGLPVRAALLTLPGNVERRENLIVVNNHLVAVYEHAGGVAVFDFNRRRDDQRLGLRLLDDSEITALYLNNLGIEALFDGRTTDALRELEAAARLAPRFGGAQANLGVVRRRLGDEAGALRAYQRALALDPDDPTVLRNLAALYQAQGKPAQARDALLAANLRGAGPFTLLIRGDLELDAGRTRRASRLYRRASREAPQIPETWLAIARLELRRARPAAARRAVERAADLAPDDPAVARARSRLAELDRRGRVGATAGR